jgi:hypothetical protein
LVFVFPSSRDQRKKEAPSFADALLFREVVDLDTVLDMLRHPGKDESEQRKVREHEVD